MSQLQLPTSFKLYIVYNVEICLLYIWSFGVCEVLVLNVSYFLKNNGGSTSLRAVYVKVGLTSFLSAVLQSSTIFAVQELAVVQ